MLKSLFYRFKWLLILATSFSALSALAGISMLKLITEAVDNFGNAPSVQQYPFSLFIVAVIAVVAFGLVSQYLFLKLSSSISYEMKKTLLQRILATNYQQIERIGGHKIMATLDSDVANLSNGLLMIPQFVFNVITVVLCLGYLFYSSWQLSIFASLVIIVIILIWSTLMKRALVHQKALREVSDEYFSNLQALTNGGKEIKLNINRVRYFYNISMVPIFEKIRVLIVKAQLIFISVDSIVNTLVYFLIGSIVYGAYEFLPSMDSKIIVSFVLVILYMVGPLSDLVGFSDDLNRVNVSTRKIERLELAEATNFKLPTSDSLKNKLQWSKITLHNIQYQYAAPFQDEKTDPTINNAHNQEDYRFSIGPVSMEINAGEVTFITGGNGSGKSTLAMILIGLYQAESGSIIIDGKLLGKDISTEQYKSNLSVIFSDFFVFPQLLDKNGELADDGVANTYLKKLWLDSKIEVKNGVLSSTELSLGQRKRLALLQSLIEDASMCVYDEVAGDQDPAFKKYFYCELLPTLKAKGKMILIISHDEHYFHKADKIIKFEDGTISKVTINRQ